MLEYVSSAQCHRGIGRVGTVTGAATPFQSTFTSGFDREKLSGPGSAGLRMGDIAYNAAGHGIATWLVDTGATCEFRYAEYEPVAGTWTEGELYSATTTNCPNTMTSVVESNGSTFVLAYRTESGDVVGHRYANGVLEAPTTIATSMTVLTGTKPLEIATDGTDYAVAFLGNVSNVARVHTAVFDSVATTWSATTTLNAGAAQGASGFDIAGNALGFLTIWLETDFDLQSSFRPAGGAWSAAEFRADARPGSLAMVSASDTDFMIAFQGLNVLVGTILFDGTTFGAVTVPNAAGALRDIVSNGTGYAIAFGFGEVLQFDGTNWEAFPKQFSSPGVESEFLVSDGGGYAFVGQGFGGILVAYSSGFESPWSIQTAVVTHAVADAVATFDGTNIQIAYSAPDTTSERIRANSYDGSTIGAPVDIDQTLQPGSAGRPSIATNSTGQMLAVWEQQFRGSPSVLAAYFDGTSWGDAFPIAGSARIPVVASNGTNFCITYLGGTFTNQVRAQFFDGTTLSGAAGLASNVSSNFANLNVTSDGSGYAIAWRRSSTAIEARIYDGTWRPVVDVDGGMTGVNLNYVRLASNGSSYVVAFAVDAGSFQLADFFSSQATYDSVGDTWTWSAPLDVQNVATTAYAFDLTSNGSDYLFAFSSLAEIWTSTGTGASWSSPVAVDQLPAGTSCYALEAASNGTNWAVAYGCGFLPVRASVFDGTAWSESIFDLRGDYLYLGSDGAGYLLEYDRSEPRVTEFDGTSWSAERTLWSPYATIGEFSAVHNGTDWFGVWSQQDAVEPLYGIYGLRDF